MLAQHAFDVARFDPVTANFYLVVEASQQLERSIATDAALIACVIEQICGFGAIWILDPAMILLRRVDIAEASKRRANNNLADFVNPAQLVAIS